MQIFYFLQIYEVCLLTHIIHCSRVLLAGNQQAFQNLAKDFVPQKLALELARLIATTSEPYGYNEWDTEVGEPATLQPHSYNWDAQVEEKISNENDEYDQDRLRGGRMTKKAANVQKNFAQYPEPKEPEESHFEPPVPRISNGTQRKAVKLNMDELVDKVKERIFSDIRNSKDLAELIKATRQIKATTPCKGNKRDSQNQRPEVTTNEANIDRQNQNLQNSAVFSRSRRTRNYDTRTRSIQMSKGTKTIVPPLLNYHISAEYGSNLEGFSETQENSQESLRRKKKDSVLRPPAAMSVNKPPSFHGLASKTPVGEVVESHDFYEKVRLKKKGKKDSYEDYVFPEKDQNPFENERLGSLGRAQKSPNSKNIKDRTKSAVDLKYIANQNANKTGMRGPTSKHKKPQPRQAEKLKYTTTAKTVKKVAGRSIIAKEDDIFDDDSQNEAPANPEKGQEPRAATMFIDGDYDDYPLPSTVDDLGPTVYVNTKRAKMKIVTNMATRTRHTPKHINYYEKLSRIAEKYNFDEPIPVKDQEDYTDKETKKKPK